MIDLSPIPSPPVAALATALAGNPATSAPPGSFGQTLGAFLDARDAVADPTPLLAACGDRQGLADDGKDLPANADPDLEDADDIITTPIWLPAALTPLPASTPAAPDSEATVRTTLAADSIAATAPSNATAVATIDPTLPSKVADPALRPQQLSAAAARPAPRAPHGLLAAAQSAPPLITAMPGISDVTRALDPAIAEALGRIAQQTAAKDTGPAPRAVPGTTPVTLGDTTASPQSIAVSATPQPAGRIFAAAMAASNWHDRAARSPEREPTDAGAALGLTTATQGIGHAVVQATGDGGGTALDLTQDSGLQRMIDRIETLRDEVSDGADARSTRIRLAPEALGGVDVAVRQEGNRIHVHFTADESATRTLIADAQPRLTELAAERGVQIGNTSVGSDSSNGSNAAPQPRALPQIARASAAVTDPETPTDDRVA